MLLRKDWHKIDERGGSEMQHHLLSKAKRPSSSTNADHYQTVKWAGYVSPELYVRNWIGY